MIRKVKKIVRDSKLYRKLVSYYMSSSGLFDQYYQSYKLSDHWKFRIDTVTKSDDNNFISRHPMAGTIRKGRQIMHNGLEIYLGSYYGPEISILLKINKGVHEPQEERVFQEVLKTIPEGGLMIEMGAFWSFYSMWFQKEVSSAINYMIEPDEVNLGQGRRNFKLNNFKGHFTKAFVGSQSNYSNSGNTICVDDFVRSNNIGFVDILHCDIQGFEMDMLHGATTLFNEKGVGYVFISTHSDILHDNCLKFLLERDFILIADCTPDQSYSEDGLIVVRAKYYSGIGPIEISKR